LSEIGRYRYHWCAFFYKTAYGSFATKYDSFNAHWVKSYGNDIRRTHGFFGKAITPAGLFFEVPVFNKWPIEIRSAVLIDLMTLKLIFC
jgi:hypothetical protein